MKRKRKDIITIAIDSPAAAGAGTQAKLISRKYNLFYLDTGKIYRLIGKLRLDYKNKFNNKLIKKKVSKLKISKLNDKKLCLMKRTFSSIKKDKTIRKIVKDFQINCAYNPPNKYSGSVLDGRDITSEYERRYN